MTEQAKAEAEKKAKELHLVFLRRLPFDKDVITENEHGKWTYSSEELATEHCIIHVKRLMENTLILTLGAKSHRLYKEQESILTELKRMK